MQLTRDQHIEANEGQLAGLKQSLKKAEELRKLVANPLFRRVILEEFCVQECARYAQLSADPTLSEAQRADALGIAQAAGHLRRWIEVIQRMAQTAEGTIGAIEQNLDVLRTSTDEDVESGAVELH